MSKVIITLTDDGEFGCRIETAFEPSLSTDPEATMTPSQNAAMIMIEALKSDEGVEFAGDEVVEYED
jgi:hypothetical protein